MAKKRDRWPQLLQLVEQDDSLPVRECGSWTEDKLYFWSKYIDITTTAMVGSPKWPGGIVYVDLFAGPGVCRIKGSGKRLPGSALIAAHAPKRFSRIVAVELEAANAAALRKRLSHSPAHEVCTVLPGDCNDLVKQVVAAIPDRALTLAFVDPPGFDARLDTLRVLATNRRVDFLLLFADSVDLIRNLELYAEQSGSKVDAMLGADCDWRSQLAALPNRSPENVRSLFEQLYQRQVRTHLGYAPPRSYPIKGPHGPLYKLLYASKDDLGFKFWDQVIAKDRSGQGSLF